MLICGHKGVFAWDFLCRLYLIYHILFILQALWGLSQDVKRELLCCYKSFTETSPPPCSLGWCGWSGLWEAFHILTLTCLFMWPSSHQNRLLKSDHGWILFATVVLDNVVFIQQFYWTHSLHKSFSSLPEGDTEWPKMFLLMRLLKINVLAYPLALKNVKSSGMNCCLCPFSGETLGNSDSSVIILPPK